MSYLGGGMCDVKQIIRCMKELHTDYRILRRTLAGHTI